MPTKYTVDKYHCSIDEEITSRFIRFHNYAVALQSNDSHRSSYSHASAYDVCDWLNSRVVDRHYNQNCYNRLIATLRNESLPWPINGLAHNLHTGNLCLAHQVDYTVDDFERCNSELTMRPVRGDFPTYSITDSEDVLR